MKMALHMVQMLLSHLLMLMAMAYKAYLGMVVVAGAGTRYWLFVGKKAQDMDSPDLD